MGGDLPPINRQQRRAARRVQFEHILAGRSLGFAHTIIVERADPGIAPHHILGPDRICKIFANRVAKIFDLLGRRLHLGRIAVIVAIGGTDQREVVLVGNDKNDSAITVLEHVGTIVLVQFAHHDV